MRTTEELEHYTWQVAGCVGSFWSLVCEAHHPGWREAALDRMVDAGVKYGLGLQRLNLLRDTSEDLALGRCYWPDEQLASVGMDAQKLVCAVKDRDMLALIPMLPLMKTWIHQTRAELSLGIAYGNGITSWRLRAASALPALIGLQTQIGRAHV